MDENSNIDLIEEIDHNDEHNRPNMSQVYVYQCKSCSKHKTIDFCDNCSMSVQQDEDQLFCLYCEKNIALPNCHNEPMEFQNLKQVENVFHFPKFKEKPKLFIEILNRFKAEINSTLEQEIKNKNGYTKLYFLNNVGGCVITIEKVLFDIAHPLKDIKNDNIASYIQYYNKILNISLVELIDKVDSNTNVIRLIPVTKFELQKLKLEEEIMYKQNKGIDFVWVIQKDQSIYNLNTWVLEKLKVDHINIEKLYQKNFTKFNFQQQFTKVDENVLVISGDNILELFALDHYKRFLPTIQEIKFNTGMVIPIGTNNFALIEKQSFESQNSVVKDLIAYFKQTDFNMQLNGGAGLNLMVDDVSPFEIEF